MAKCHGMRIEYRVGEGPGDAAFDMEPCTVERYILFFSDRGVKWTVTLENEDGWCGSGYTTAVNGSLSVRQVSDYGPATHLPKGRKAIDVPDVTYRYAKYGSFEMVTKDGAEVEECCVESGKSDFLVFCYEDQGDAYYPANWWSVNMDLFDELPRSMNNRPVWILYGDSGSGKSTIGHYLKKSYMVFETDSVENGLLPEVIWADVIIVGNRWKESFSMKDVISRIPDDAEPISVCFSKD